ncbi:hypothetical protein KKC63_03085 [Patescibacteria group bacterium]|nr:hypothetical protein [Patescibacteria group bacterium]MBU4023377.1 hypothetical protein [Patescibacteria group bacterium]MBU4078316.1 hypothetical protein [Patescibacteria group bacterium]
MNKKIIFGLILCSFLFGFVALAQEAEISADDFGLSEPTLLPNHTFYFLKDWWRDTKLFFTINPVKDAELRQEIANEKLLEIKSMIEADVEESVLKKAREKYQIQQRKLEAAIEKIQNREDERTEKFRDKFFEHQVLHQKILEKLEQTVSEETLQKIQEMRIEHIDRFKESMFKIGQQEQVQERLENALQNIQGSEFKDFENLDIIGRIRERIENEEKNQILQKVEGNLRQNFTEKIEALPIEEKEEIEEFFQALQGNAENQLRILEKIQEQAQERIETRERINVGVETIQEKILEQERQRDQEQINKPDNTDKGSSKK